MRWPWTVPARTREATPREEPSAQAEPRGAADNLVHSTSELPTREFVVPATLRGERTVHTAPTREFPAHVDPSKPFPAREQAGAATHLDGAEVSSVDSPFGLHARKQGRSTSEATRPVATADTSAAETVRPKAAIR
jgi:hypothetical protein